MGKKQKMKKGKKPTNLHQKAKYQQHYFKVPINKKRKLVKHIKKQPNDLQAAAKLIQL